MSFSTLTESLSVQLWCQSTLRDHSNRLNAARANLIRSLSPSMLIELVWSVKVKWIDQFDLSRSNWSGSQFVTQWSILNCILLVWSAIYQGKLYWADSGILDICLTVHLLSTRLVCLTVKVSSLTDWLISHCRQVDIPQCTSALTPYSNSRRMVPLGLYKHFTTADSCRSRSSALTYKVQSDFNFGPQVISYCCVI